MTANNSELTDLDTYLGKFTSMEEADSGPRPELKRHKAAVNGVEFINANNTPDMLGAADVAARFPNSSSYLGAHTAVLKELVDRGMLITPEDHGPARDIDGLRYSRAVTFYKHPDAKQGMRMEQKIDGAVMLQLGGHAEGESIRQVKTSQIYDASEIRAAMDAVLERPEFAQEAAIAQAHHDRVFRDPRLGGQNAQAGFEAGAVPDPADPRYLDYVVPS